MKVGLAVRKAQGLRHGSSTPRNGAAASAAVRKAIAKRRADKLGPVLFQIRRAGITSYARTARELNARGVPAARGCHWHKATVRDLLFGGRRAP